MVHCGKQYLDHFIFEETYKDIIGKNKYWLNGDIDFRKFCNKWAKKKGNEQSIFKQ